MRVATDIGGTFTDLVSINNDGTMILEKTHTTPPNFEQGVIDVLLKSGINLNEIETFIHGTTTIINALTERKGAKTGLITTKGFRDVLEIARCNRPDLFNLTFKAPEPFVPRHLRLEVSQRMNYKGEVQEELTLEDVEKAVEYFKSEGVNAIAICYLHSYANDSHEIKTAEYIKKLYPEAFITYSSEITKEWREFERTTTTVLNSYVMPIASKYVDKLEKKLLESNINGEKYIMQSNGGATTFKQSKKTPISMVESGPVAGIFGSALLGKIIGLDNVIAFDVGGTTAKCSLIANGQVTVVTDYRIERTERFSGYPVMTPVVDIVEIGNGGGSIAWIDDAKSLKVGPKSAGALPGPIAYGIGGTLPTTTDSCLVTGRLSEKNFDKKVDIQNIRNILVEKIGKNFNMNAEQSAYSVIKVAESNMLNALKLISVRKGYDPREFSLVAFGGGGPMHAATLAKELGIEKVVIPVAASVFSAWGMLMTDIRHDFLKTFICRTNTTSLDEINNQWQTLVDEANAEFEEENVDKSNIVYSFTADMRYMGQEHTVKIPVPKMPWSKSDKQEAINKFHELHEKNYTFRLQDTPTEIVNFHLTAFGKIEKPVIKEIDTPKTTIENCIIETRPVYFDDAGFVDTKIYDRSKLWAGFEVSGYGIVEEPTASTIFFKDQKLSVDKYGNLIITKEAK